jgi:ArsR family transcriptional regulator
MHHDIIGPGMGDRRVKIGDRQLALISRALADPKRFQILQRIADSKVSPTCSCVCDWTGLAPATISHHLKELDEAGLIKIERRGKFAHISVRRDVWKGYLKRLSAL